MTDGPGPINSSRPSRSSQSPSHRPSDPSTQRTDTQRTGTPREDEPPGQDEHQALDKLSSLVSEYQDQKLSKSRVISRISVLIDDNATLSDLEKEKAINLYVEELNSIDSRRDPRFFMPHQEKDKTVDKSIHKILNQVVNQARSQDDFQDDGTVV